MYEKIRQHNDIRYPIRKVNTANDKIFLLVQVIAINLHVNFQFDDRVGHPCRSSTGQPRIQDIG